MNYRKQIVEYKYPIIILLVFLGIFSIFLILNLSLISIVHCNASEILPVVVYVNYSVIDLLSTYIIIIISVLALISIIFIENEKVKKIFLSICPIICVITILLLFINPEILILNPKGYPPTILEEIYVSGIIYILLELFLILIFFYLIYSEGFIKKYFQYSIIIFIGIFFSNFIHENGHAFFVLISGGTITRYIPFAFIDPNYSAGVILFEKVPSGLIPLVLMGGEIFQWISILIFGTLLKFKALNKNLNIFFKVIIIIAWLDFPLYTLNNYFNIPHWFLIGSKQGDIINFSNITGFPLWIMISMALLQLTIGVIVIVSDIYKKYYKEPVQSFQKKWNLLQNKI